MRWLDGITEKDELDSFLTNLNAILQKTVTSKEAIVSVLKEYFPNFNHDEKGKNIDQKVILYHANKYNRRKKT